MTMVSNVVKEYNLKYIPCLVQVKNIQKYVDTDVFSAPIRGKIFTLQDAAMF